MRKVKSVFAALCLALPIVGTAGIGFAQDLTPTYTNSIGIEFVQIPAGTVLVETEKNMFDEPVFGTIAVVNQPFYLGKYEVTQEQWAAVMGANPSTYKGRNNPVENVSWAEVQEFISRLNAMTGHTYRLPTEMEWELAARGDANSLYFFGESEENLGNYAWYADNAEGRTQPVGQKQPNPHGLYDIYGNVREMVQDWYGAYPPTPALTDYTGPASGSGHVSRGGSFADTSWDFRSQSRAEAAPDARSDSMGFRLAMSMFDLPTYTDPFGTEFILIPAASFMITPGTEATVTQPYYIGKYEVTQKLWEEVMGENPAYFQKGGDYPVERVSFQDVQEFLTRLNAMAGHNRYRLPTEIEWEIAARAGTSTSYFFGNPALLEDYAWFNVNAGITTHPVGTRLPNPYGLYDVYGNVWEWTSDWYAPLPDVPSLVDFNGPEDGWRRVNRGGSWNNAAGFCRSDARSSYTDLNRVTGIGFRLALTPE